MEKIKEAVGLNIAANPNRQKTRGIRSLVAGIIALLSFLLMIYGEAFILIGLAAAVFSLIDARRALKAGGAEGMAVTGMILSILALSLAAILVLAFLFMIIFVRHFS